MSSYKFKGTYVRKGQLSAAKVGKRLESLRKDNKGELTTEVVVDDARSENSPLHAAFTWDDEAAAEAHRKTEARQLIKSVKVIVKDADKKDREVTAFVNVRDEKDGHHYYQNTLVMVQSVSEWASAIQVLQGNLLAVQEGLDELLSITPDSVAKSAKAKGQLKLITSSVKAAAKAAQELSVAV